MEDANGGRQGCLGESDHVEGPRVQALWDEGGCTQDRDCGEAWASFQD